MVANKKAYVAAPVVGITNEQRQEIDRVVHVLEKCFDQIYCPWNLKIPNAWNMPMVQWARCVFTQDVLHLDQAHTVIVCDYGRHSSCGTAWEAGYAFAKGKKIIVVRMPNVKEVSLMVNNGCTIVVSYEDFINDNWITPDYVEENKTSPVIQN